MPYFDRGAIIRFFNVLLRGIDNYKPKTVAEPSTQNRSAVWSANPSEKALETINIRMAFNREKTVQSALSQNISYCIARILEKSRSDNLEKSELKNHESSSNSNVVLPASEVKR